MPSEQELLDRIHQLEQQNNELQDKLDAIYSILAPDYEQAEYIDPEEDEEPGGGLVNIQGI